MLVFLDFEASSLNKNSYPVEVAWVFEDGTSRSFLIRPASGWTDWSAEAEAIHGISRDLLERQGSDVTTIVEEMLTSLGEADLVASAPSWDGKWLSTLMRAAGKPRHALRLRKSDDAFREAATTPASGPIPQDELERLVEEIIRETEPETPAHRALPDAMLEWTRWKAVKRRAATWRPPRAEATGD